jgi:hypothetical protein
VQIFSANVGVKNTQIRPEIAIYNANPVLTQLTVFGRRGATSPPS